MSEKFPEFQENFSKRFIKYIPGENADWLKQRNIWAFVLLLAIAERARRFNGHIDGLKIGECLIGDYQEYGIPSERTYRTAKQILVDLKMINIVETCRTRKKSTTGTTTVGTKVKLIDSTIWDINPETCNDLKDDRPTTDRRPTDDEQEVKEDKECKEIKDIAQTASLLRKEISFSFEKGIFENISAEDLAAWKELYPSANLDIELKKMVQWCLANPSKTKSKKLWRRFITNWLRNTNEHAINKEASFANKIQFLNSDRRTRDKQGNPVTSPADKLF